MAKQIKCKCIYYESMATVDSYYTHGTSFYQFIWLFEYGTLFDPAFATDTTVILSCKRRKINPLPAFNCDKLNTTETAKSVTTINCRQMSRTKVMVQMDVKYR